MSKPVILTGLRANNDLHIGNYLGAIMPMVDMATRRTGEHQVNFFVPDLHSFTTPIDHSKLSAQTLDNIRMYVAAGLPLDDNDIYLYRQSFIPAHSELTWILSCFTYVGEMRRMTQFKEKSEGVEAGTLRGEELTTAHNGGESDKFPTKAAREGVSVGLFSYPILMAADILLYGATYVPVGDDQTQHLEFTRDIAERMNNKFGGLFDLPLHAAKQHEFFGKDQGLRIRDLVNPDKKMSKSADTDKGVIFLRDTPEAAHRKIMSATTDSMGEVKYNHQERPGVSNLLDILRLLGGSPDDYIGQNQYGPLKSAAADLVAEFLSNFQGRLATVDDAVLLDKLERSEEEMRISAADRLLKVQQAVGLR